MPGRGDGWWNVGERMRDRVGDAAQALSRQDRFTIFNDHLRVKEVRITSRGCPVPRGWLQQTSTGRLFLDRARIAAEERLDGKYLPSTSDKHLSPSEVAMGYKNLQEAERGFRDMKSTLMLTPVFHRLEPRMSAHGLIC